MPKALDINTRAHTHERRHIWLLFSTQHTEQTAAARIDRLILPRTTAEKHTVHLSEAVNHTRPHRNLIRDLCLNACLKLCSLWWGDLDLSVSINRLCTVHIVSLSIHMQNVKKLTGGGARVLICFSFVCDAFPVETGSLDGMYRKTSFYQDLLFTGCTGGINIFKGNNI